MISQDCRRRGAREGEDVEHFACFASFLVFLLRRRDKKCRRHKKNRPQQNAAGDAFAAVVCSKPSSALAETQPAQGAVSMDGRPLATRRFNRQALPPRLEQSPEELTEPPPFY